MMTVDFLDVRYRRSPVSENIPMNGKWTGSSRMLTMMAGYLEAYGAQTISGLPMGRSIVPDDPQIFAGCVSYKELAALPAGTPPRREFDAYATWLIDSSRDKEPMVEPEMYNTYVYWEKVDGVEDGPEFSQSYKGPIPGAEQGGKLGIPAAPTQGNDDFIKRSALKYLDVADQAIGTVIRGHRPGFRARGYQKTWRATSWRAGDGFRGRDDGGFNGHSDRPFERRGQFTTDANDFDLRNGNNKRVRDRDDDDERDYKRRELETIAAYLRDHPDEGRKLLERAQGPDDLARMKDLDLGSGQRGDGNAKGKEREDGRAAAGRSTDLNSYRDKPAESGDEDAEGEIVPNTE